VNSRYFTFSFFPFLSVSKEERLDGLHKAMEGLAIKSILSGLTEEHVKDYQRDFLCYRIPGLKEEAYMVYCIVYTIVSKALKTFP